MTSHMALPQPDLQRLRLKDRLLGVLGFAAAILLLRFPLKHGVAVVGRLNRSTPKPAAMAEAQTIVAASRRPPAGFRAGPRAWRALSPPRSRPC